MEIVLVDIKALIIYQTCLKMLD